MPRGISFYEEARWQRRLWVPRNNPGLVLHFDASELGSISAPSGVSAWKDLTGRGQDGQQSTSTARPALLQTGTDAPGLSFDGGDGLQLSSLGSLPTGSNAHTALVVWSRSLVATTTEKFFYWGDAATARAARGFGIRNGNVDVGINGFDQTTSVFSSGDHFAVWRLSGTASTINIDGGSDLTSTFGGTPATTSTASYVGRWTTGGSPDELFIGIIREIQVWNVNATLDLRQRIEGAAAWKWDMLLGGSRYRSNLPTSHPYKARPPLIGE